MRNPWAQKYNTTTRIIRRTSIYRSTGQPQKCSQGRTVPFYQRRGSTVRNGDVSPLKGCLLYVHLTLTLAHSPMNGGSTAGPRVDEDDDDRHIERVLFFASAIELASDVARNILNSQRLPTQLLPGT